MKPIQIDMTTFKCAIKVDGQLQNLLEYNSIYDFMFVVFSRFLNRKCLDDIIVSSGELQSPSTIHRLCKIVAVIFSVSRFYQ